MDASTLKMPPYPSFPLLLPLPQNLPVTIPPPPLPPILDPCTPSPRRCSLVERPTTRSHSTGDMKKAELALLYWVWQRLTNRRSRLGVVGGGVGFGHSGLPDQQCRTQRGGMKLS